MKKQEKALNLRKQREARLDDQNEACVDEVLDQLEGSALGDMLDFLSKELIRWVVVKLLEVCIRFDIYRIPGKKYTE